MIVELVTVAEFAATFGIPAGTLYRWAHEDNWARYGTPTARLYPLEEMLHTYTKRREEK